ncbi:MAG: biopolymer transporter ExbD [Kofleriaceae bacterium]|nr:biopolymer transporter ExbD [Kofleriaceae bacterium]
MSGGHKKGTLNSEINVTPMVDVMLVLLVIFMITATTMDSSSVDLDLPQTNAAVAGDPEGRLTLSIDKNRQLFLGETQVSWVELEDKLRANERIKKEKELYIEADKDLPYAVVVTAMAAAQQAGVSKLQMRTDPTANLDYGQLDKASGGVVEGVEGGVVAPEEDSGKTE